MRDHARVVSCAALLTCGLLGAGAQAAGNDEKTECIAASDQGQQLRDDGRYKLAHEAFARCARPTCPAIVSRDCGAWLFDVDQRTPSVLFDARDDKGADLSDVEVHVDGAPFAARLTGLPAPIDPGEHTFRYEAEGFVPLEERVVVQAGEKNRVLHVRLSPTQAVAARAPVHPVPQVQAPGIPATTWVFGGIALAAFASEAYFGIAGLEQRSGDMSGPNKCAPLCASSEKSSIQTKFAIADVSLGAGLVSAGLAAYFLVRTRHTPAAEHAAAERAFDVTARPGGALASWGGRF